MRAVFGQDKLCHGQLKGVCTQAIDWTDLVELVAQVNRVDVITFEV